MNTLRGDPLRRRQPGINRPERTVFNNRRNCTDLISRFTTVIWRISSVGMYIIQAVLKVWIFIQV